MDFSKSNALGARLAELVPGGCHTYAKGDDQYPELAPALIARGQGLSRVGRGRQRVHRVRHGAARGHARPRVSRGGRGRARVARARHELHAARAPIELECAEAFLGLIDGAEMVKFTKDGSTATTGGAQAGARATGRDLVAICAEHPFFSYDDWFIGTTTIRRRHPARGRRPDRAVPLQRPRQRCARRSRRTPARSPR